MGNKCAPASKRSQKIKKYPKESKMKMEEEKTKVENSDVNYISLGDKNNNPQFSPVSTAEVLNELFSRPRNKDIKNIREHSLENKEDTKYIYIRGKNMFASAARKAFTDETDFVFNPDDIWLLISQGFGHYVNNHSEDLRDKIVDFQGKKHIEISIEENPNREDWENIFPLFSKKIEENIGEELHSALMANFSTTGPIQKIASEITLMYAMKSYFSYGASTYCGIQGFLIEGTLSDWEMIKEKVCFLKKYGKEKWLRCVEEIIKKIIKQLKGEEVDKEFWNNFYKYKGRMGSGGSPTVTGWIVNFFPYLGGNVENRQSEIPWNIKKTIEDDTYSFGICTCPFKFDGEDMRFLAGFVGAEQRGKYIRPVQGWVLMAGEEPV